MIGDSERCREFNTRVDFYFKKKKKKKKLIPTKFSSSHTHTQWHTHTNNTHIHWYSDTHTPTKQLLLSPHQFFFLHTHTQWHTHTHRYLYLLPPCNEQTRKSCLANKFFWPLEDLDFFFFVLRCVFESLFFLLVTKMLKRERLKRECKCTNKKNFNLIFLNRVHWFCVFFRFANFFLWRILVGSI